MEFQIAENIGTMKKPRIMIVEDEKHLAMIMKEVLINFGYDCCKLFTSGEEAVSNMEQEKPDIILMDINLDGEMDGIDTANKIRSDFGVPIIFLTAHEEKEIRELAEIIEPAGYFIKPVAGEILKSAIDKIILSKKS
ncbi:MAG: response regulator [Candidatus Scalindua sp.]